MDVDYKFTNKAEQSIAAAIQLAKDYANAQVHPAHLAHVLLNEGSGEQQQGGQSLFVSVISKAGGDPVSIILQIRLFALLY